MYDDVYKTRGICVEKGHLLDRNDALRKYKGRYVFQEIHVRDEWHQFAIFSELSSNPASMECSKTLDAYACFPGFSGEQADAEQAYIQADLPEVDDDGNGLETWGRIPREYWPEEWIGKYTVPRVEIR